MFVAVGKGCGGAPKIVRTDEVSTFRQGAENFAGNARRHTGSGP
jgi:hypothetical protein